MLSIVAGVSRVVIDSNADTATVTILDEADSMFFYMYEQFTIDIFITFIVVIIGFDAVQYSVRETVGFITLKIVSSGLVSSDVVLRLCEETGGSAMSMC